MMNKKPILYPVKIEFRVTKEMRENLNSLAQKKGVRVADLMRSAVDSVLENSSYDVPKKDWAAYTRAHKSIQESLEYLKSLGLAKQE